MSSVTTERLCKSLFYKFFCTNLSQVVLRRFYTERFLCNTICVTLICLISSFHTNLKRQNSSDLLRIVSSTFQCRKLPRFRNLHVQISEIIKIVPCKTTFRNSSKPFSEAATGGVPEKAFFKHFKIFTGKRLCWGIFFNKVAGHQPCNFIKVWIKKRLQHSYFL